MALDSLSIFILSMNWMIDHFLCLFGIRQPIPMTEYNIKGKAVIVTGANCGLGKSIALEMAKRNAIVIMGCRDAEKGRKAQQEIILESGNKKVELYCLDLADLKSVRKFANSVLTLHPVIDLLVNNAGVFYDCAERKFTKDGFEIHMGTNHLGHFLLTTLMIDALKISSMARVVSISSSGLIFHNFFMDDLMLENVSDFGTNNFLPYSNSKFANALFTKQLAVRGDLRTYAVCPSYVKTNILNNYTGVISFICSLFYKTCGISSAKAAEYVLSCCLGKEMEKDSGKFFRFGKNVPSIDELFTLEMAEKFWKKCETFVEI